MRGAIVNQIRHFSCFPVVKLSHLSLMVELRQVCLFGLLVNITLAKEQCIRAISARLGVTTILLGLASVSWRGEHGGQSKSLLLSEHLIILLRFAALLSVGEPLV